jgi:hypothetical protein
VTVMTKVKSRNKRKSSEHSRVVKTFRHPEIPLDDAASDIIDLTVLLLARRNYSRVQMLERFQKSLACTPHWVGDDAGFEDDPEDVPGEVLSRWHLLPRYTLNGKPRPLPARGRLSVTSLIRSISRRVNPQLILEYLTNTGALKQEKDLHLPQERSMPLQNDPRLQRIHHVRVVRNLLRTVEGNARQRGGRFQRVAEGVVPVGECERLIEEHKDSALNLLQTVDANFSLHSASDIPETDRRRMSVSVTFSDDRPLPPLASVPARSRQGRSK